MQSLLFIYLFVLLESVFMRWLKIVLVPAKHLDCALIGRPPAVVSDPKFTLDKSMSRGKCVCIWIQAQFFFLSAGRVMAHRIWYSFYNISTSSTLGLLSSTLRRSSGFAVPLSNHLMEPFPFYEERVKHRHVRTTARGPLRFLIRPEFGRNYMNSK